MRAGRIPATRLGSSERCRLPMRIARHRASPREPFRLLPTTRRRTPGGTPTLNSNTAGRSDGPSEPPLRGHRHPNAQPWPLFRGKRIVSGGVVWVAIAHRGVLRVAGWSGYRIGRSEERVLAERARGREAPYGGRGGGPCLGRARAGRRSPDGSRRPRPWRLRLGGSGGRGVAFDPVVGPLRSFRGVRLGAPVIAALGRADRFVLPPNAAFLEQILTRRASVARIAVPDPARPGADTDRLLRSFPAIWSRGPPRGGWRLVYDRSGWRVWCREDGGEAGRDDTPPGRLDVTRAEAPSRPSRPPWRSEHAKGNEVVGARSRMSRP